MSDVVQNADKVVSANVFRYFNNPEGVLAEIYKTLHQGGKYLFNVGLISPEAQNPFSLFFKAVEAVLNEELGKEVKIPLPKVLEDREKYDKNILIQLAERSGFTITRYEERPIVYNEKQLQAMFHSILSGMESGLKILYSQKTEQIMQKIYERTVGYTKQPLFVGTIAYVCLRKEQQNPK